MKMIEVRGVNDVQFICEAMGYSIYLISPWECMYRVIKRISRGIGKMAGYGIAQNNVDNGLKINKEKGHPKICW